MYFTKLGVAVGPREVVMALHITYYGVLLYFFFSTNLKWVTIHHYTQYRCFLDDLTSIGLKAIDNLGSQFHV